MMIPLIPTKKDSDQSTIGFYVKTDPGDADSDKVKKYVPTFNGTGTLEDMMDFLTDFHDLMQMRADEDNGPALFTTMQLLLKDEARDAWNDSYDDVVEGLDENDDERAKAAFDATMEGWMNVLLTGEENVAEELKDELLSMSKKKPPEMTIAQVTARLKKMSKFISLLPGDTEALTKRELLTILKKIVPNNWLIEMKKKADYNRMTLPEQYCP